MPSLIGKEIIFTTRWLIPLAIMLFEALVATPSTARAQKAAPYVAGATRTIADAIAKRDVDSEVTIAGRAVVAAGKLQSSSFDVAIEDGTAGIRLFSRMPKSEVKEGDSVTATGTVKTYRGSLELVASRVEIVEAPRRILSRLLKKS